MEGPDASGKGGAIRHLVEPLDPRHFRVSSFSKPTADEKRHHHLWRFYRDAAGPRRDVPCSTAAGTAGCSSSAWRASPRRSSGVAATRRSSTSRRTLVHEGVILVKFWLQISDDEQLRRFEERRTIRSSAGSSPTRTGATASATASTSRRRGHVRPHRPRAGAVGRHRRRAEAARPASLVIERPTSASRKACAAGAGRSRRARPMR